MNALAILKAARKRISDPARWTQGASARMADGRIVDPFASDACSWCSIGALYAETAGPEAADALSALGEAVPDRAWVASWNDSATHAEVLAAFDKAIARVEGGGKRRRGRAR